MSVSSVRATWSSPSAGLLQVAAGFAAVAVGLGTGYVATLDASTGRLLVLVLGAFTIPVVLLNLEIGGLVFLGFLWSWASDVAIKIYGAPSIALPFGVGLAVAIVVRQLIRGERVGFGLLQPLRVVAPYFLVALASVVFSRFSGVVSPLAPGPLETLNLLIRDLVVFWLLTVLFEHAGRLKGAAGVLVVVAGLLSLINLHQYVTGNFTSNYGGFAQSSVLHIVGTIEDARLGGPLNSPNYFALSLIYTVPLGLGLLRTHLSGWMRLAVAGAVGVTVLTILLTFSRGGAVILAIVVLVSLTRHRIGAPHLVAGALALALAIVVMPPTVWERLATIVDPFVESRQAGITIDTSVELRIAAQDAAMKMFAASPFLGVGVGNYPPMYQEFCRSDMLFCPFEVFWAHNLYLELLAETGVFGLFTYLGMIAVALTGLRRARLASTGADQSSHDFREVAFGLELAMLAYLLGGLQIHGSYPRYFWMLLALCIVAARRPAEVARVTSALMDRAALSEAITTRLPVIRRQSRGGLVQNNGNASGARAATVSAPPGQPAAPTTTVAASVGSEPTARLGSRVAGATIWSYGAHVVSRGSVLVGLAVLAHLLSPHEFGVFAMAMVAVNLLEVVKDFGLRPAVIYLLGSEEPGPVLDTAFYLSVGTGVGLTVLLFVLAGPAGWFFGDPAVTDLLRVLAITFALAGVHAIPDAILRHRLDFRRRFWVEVGSPLARYGVAAGLAVVGFGVWSLVIGQIAGIALAAFLAVTLAAWRPHWRFSASAARQLARFAGQLSLIDVLAALIYNLDYLLVGYFLGSAALGLYSLAYRLPEAALIGSAYVFSTVLLPAYVQLSGDRAQLRDGFLRAFSYIGLVLAPVAAGIAVLAPVLVPLLFGEAWHEAVPVVQLLSISAFVQGMLFTVGSVLVAAGRPRAVIVAQLASAATIIPGLYVAAQYSIVAVATVHIVGAIVFGVVKLALVCRALSLDGSALVRAILPTAIAAGVMVLAIQAVWTLAAHWPDIMVAAVGVVTGVVVYGAMVVVLMGGAVREIRETAVALVKGA